MGVQTRSDQFVTSADSMPVVRASPGPAYLATNRLSRALYTEACAGGTTFNLARYLFLDPRSQDFFCEWETVAADCAAALRTEAGRNPYDRGLTDLIGELSTRSDPFRAWWASHNVKLHYTATKTMQHPVVGTLELTGEALQLPSDPDLTIITYTCEPASPTEQALTFLASWSTREDSTETVGPGRSTVTRFPQS